MAGEGKESFISIEEYNEEDYEEEDYHILEKYEDINTENITELCLHKNISNIDSIQVCSDCGINLGIEISFEPEWRYYGENDNKHNSDPSRCHIRKAEEKNIYRDIEKFKFPIDIAREINDSYLEVTKGQIRRGTFRKCIIFGCAFNVYKKQGTTQDPEELREKFGLSKKEASKGLTFYNLNKTERNKPMYLSPTIFIPGIMKKFNANGEHIKRVGELYLRIQNRSKLLNHSNPQSVIASLIYYYFRLIGGNINCARFSKIVKLSDITISKIAKNISEVLKTTDRVKLS